MKRALFVVAIAACLAGLTHVALAQNRPMSPEGTTSAQVLGKWVKPEKTTYTLGGNAYQGGKWIDVTYGRPLRRGRDLFGHGANYGKDALVGAPIWRAGANVSTQLHTEVPLSIGGKTVPAGTYTLFIDLKENNWTLVVSSWPAQKVYDANNKTALWGSYDYTPDKDVVRTKMKLETLPHSVEQLTWQFVDMNEKGGTLAISWGNQMASVLFTVAGN